MKNFIDLYRVITLRDDNNNFEQGVPLGVAATGQDQPLSGYGKSAFNQGAITGNEAYFDPSYFVSYIYDTNPEMKTIRDDAEDKVKDNIEKKIEYARQLVANGNIKAAENIFDSIVTFGLDGPELAAIEAMKAELKEKIITEKSTKDDELSDSIKKGIALISGNLVPVDATYKGQDLTSAEALNSDDINISARAFTFQFGKQINDLLVTEKTNKSSIDNAKIAAKEVIDIVATDEEKKKIAAYEPKKIADEFIVAGPKKFSKKDLRNDNREFAKEKEIKAAIKEEKEKLKGNITADEQEEHRINASALQLELETVQTAKATHFKGMAVEAIKMLGMKAIEETQTERENSGANQEVEQQVEASMGLFAKIVAAKKAEKETEIRPGQVAKDDIKLQENTAPDMQEVTAQPSKKEALSLDERIALKEKANREYFKEQDQEEQRLGSETFAKKQMIMENLQQAYNDKNKFDVDAALRIINDAEIDLTKKDYNHTHGNLKSAAAGDLLQEAKLAREKSQELQKKLGKEADKIKESEAYKKHAIQVGNIKSIIDGLSRERDYLVKKTKSGVATKKEEERLSKLEPMIDGLGKKLGSLEKELSRERNWQGKIRQEHEEHKSLRRSKSFSYRSDVDPSHMEFLAEKKDGPIQNVDPKKSEVDFGNKEDVKKRAKGLGAKLCKKEMQGVVDKYGLEAGAAASKYLKNKEFSMPRTPGKE